MPIAGPRTQFGPDPGYRNPEDRKPDFINHWKFPLPIAWPGESAGLNIVDRRGMVLAAGQVRTLWRQAIGYIAAQAPYSWTANGPQPNMPETVPQRGFQITTALRYMASSRNLPSGDNSRFAGMHTVYPKQNRYKTITVGAGQKAGQPTTRNRMTSFGSRVPVLNPQVQAAQGSQ
jgi:hypothetical protein